MTTITVKHDPVSVIIGPRITEKAARLAEKKVYTFNVTQAANAASIKAAIKTLYKVNPIDVKIVAVPSKRSFVRGKAGVKQGGKKAYVTLGKKETIEFV